MKIHGITLLGFVFMLVACNATPAIMPTQVPTFTQTSMPTVTPETPTSTPTLTKTPVPTPIPDILSWWQGEGAANDSVGSYDGALMSGVTFAPGKVGQAFRFDGVDDYVEIPDSPSWTLGDQDFTIVLWVKFNEMQDRVPFIGHNEGGGEFSKWIFWYDAYGHNEPGGPALRFHINSPSLGPKDTVIAPWVPVTGRWYHVGVTRNGSTYSLYIDGVVAATSTQTDTIPDAATPLNLGNTEAYFLNGLIDEVMIFQRGLSAEEISAIFTAALGN